jgi:riboflavin synthase
MFTGIVEEIGEVLDVRESADVVVFTVRGRTVTSDARHGDSIAVSGVCLTVVDPDGSLGDSGDGTFTVELVPETLKRSSLSAVTAGARVNLERAVPVGGRLGGHIVQGHVDGVATVLSRTPGERTDEVRFSLAPDLARYVVEKGSITVDGVSLTVAGVSEDTFTVALIPTTLSHTTLGSREPGDTVNLEVDVVAKYVERLTAGYRGAASAHEEAR